MIELVGCDEAFNACCNVATLNLEYIYLMFEVWYRFKDPRIIDGRTYSEPPVSRYCLGEAA